jgi:hypothetical protein
MNPIECTAHYHLTSVLRSDSCQCPRNDTLLRSEAACFNGIFKADATNSMAQSLLEKPRVAQQLRKFPVVYGKRRLDCGLWDVVSCGIVFRRNRLHLHCVHNSQPLNLTLRKFNIVHVLSHCLRSILIPYLRVYKPHACVNCT